LEKSVIKKENTSPSRGEERKSKIHQTLDEKGDFVPNGEKGPSTQGENYQSQECAVLGRQGIFSIMKRKKEKRWG